MGEFPKENSDTLWAMLVPNHVKYVFRVGLSSVNTRGKEGVGVPNREATIL